MSSAMAPLVTVQICTYNRGLVVEQCLDALGRQTWPVDRFDVVLVDDGSTDDTPDRLDPDDYGFDLHVVRVPHGGLARARNAGIRAARGEILLFIDDDTIADPRLIEEHWRAHQRGPRLVVLGWVNHVDPGRAPERRRKRLADWSTSFFWTANLSIRRSEIIAADLFDEAFTEYGWEDLELGERLRDRGLERCYHPRAIVSHVKHRWHAADVPALLRQAEASGRSAVVFVRKRPTWRARLATGVSAPRMAANRLLEPMEGWFRRRIAAAGSGPLAGPDWIAAYLWQRLAYFRAVRAALRDRTGERDLEIGR